VAVEGSAKRPAVRPQDVAGLLAQGTLSDLERITATLDAAPWGPVARQVEQVLDGAPPAGVASMLRRAITRARAEAERSERAEVAAEIAELIAATGLTVAEVAARTGTSRSRLSTYRSGSVVPSAAYLVRLRRVAASLRTPP